MFFLFLTFGIFLMHTVVLLWTGANTAKLAGNVWFKILPLVLTAVFMAVMFLSRIVFSPALAQTAYIWLGSLFLWFALVFAVIVVQLALLVCKVQLPQNLGPAVFIVAALISLASIFNAYRTPALKEITLSSPKIKRPLIVAQVTDMHLGEGISRFRVEKFFKALKAKDPDIIVFTGDIFERGGRAAGQYLDLFRTLNPRCGKFAVLGNHEYYGGVEHNLKLWSAAGLTPLLNARASACGVNIMGVNDVRTARISATEFSRFAAENIDKEVYNILLSHTPLYQDEAAAAGVNLMLSGHTHNGQIWPFNWLVRLQFKHVYGLYWDAARPDFADYVSAGTFYWGPPMRFLTYNEAPVFKLTPDEK
jgi:predicted MPP superfamily phosphohydrolase